MRATRGAAAAAIALALTLAQLLSGCGAGEQAPSTDAAIEPELGAADVEAAYQEALANANPVTQLGEFQRGAPEDVVRLLLQWDTAGLRFEGAYADALARLYCYEPERSCQSDEPAWDFALIVDGYTLDPVLVQEDSAQYQVTFDEVGALWPDRMQGPIGSPPERLSLKRMAGLWRIVGLDSQMPPHLSRNGALRRFRGVQPDSEVIARWLRELDEER